MMGQRYRYRDGLDPSWPRNKPSIDRQTRSASVRNFYFEISRLLRLIDRSIDLLVRVDLRRSTPSVITSPFTNPITSSCTNPSTLMYEPITYQPHHHLRTPSCRPAPTLSSPCTDMCYALPSVKARQVPASEIDRITGRLPPTQVNLNFIKTLEKIPGSIPAPTHPEFDVRGLGEVQPTWLRF